MWILLSLLTAFSQSLRDISSKKSLARTDEYTISWSSSLFAFLVLIPILIAIGFPPIKPLFWLALLISGSLNVLALIYYMKAYKLSDVSLVAPLLTFSSLFLLLTSPLIVHESPSFLGVIGVFLIVIGSYLLNINKRKMGYFAPFYALMSEKGSRYMLVVALLWSISANFDKIGVQSSSPIFWILAVNFFIAVILFPIIFYKTRFSIRNIINLSKQISNVRVWIFHTTTYVFNMFALQYAFVAYVISIKRASAIFTVLLGYFFLKEKNIKDRLFGVLVMIIGVILITFSK